MAYVYRKTIKVFYRFKGSEYYDLNLHDGSSTERLDIDKLDESDRLSTSAVLYATSMEKDLEAVGHQVRLGDQPHFCFNGREFAGELQDDPDTELLTSFLWNNNGELNETDIYQMLANGDGPDESFDAAVDEGFVELNAALDAYLEITPCSCRIEVANIDDALVKWYSPDRVGAFDSTAEGHLKALWKEESICLTREPIVLPYYDSPLDASFRPFCLDPDALRYAPVKTQVGYAGIIKYEYSNYDDDDNFEEDEE